LSLPFDSKRNIALDIANGLSVLHQCGVIHGDIKPDNILIFEAPKLHAKLADFSHSVLGTGDYQYLVGGTATYAAPEWKNAAPTSLLLKTDIYSYGLIFGGLILGSELIDCIHVDAESEVTTHATTRDHFFRDLKEKDLMQRHIFDLIRDADEKRPELHLEEIPMIENVLSLTLQVDPIKRDLEKVIEYLSGKQQQPQKKYPRQLQKKLASNGVGLTEAH
jgi:serine/threonine protein kinase